MADAARPVVELVGGARPNFMKLVSVWRAIEDRGDLEARIVHTGQHYDDDMSRVFFEQLGLPEPYVHLGVGSGPHGSQTGRMLERYEAHLLGDRPAATVVFGDVNSTVAAALAASKLGVPIAHVEAGLRSNDRSMPEEINRIVTDHVSDLLLATEEYAVEQLRHEGIDPERIELVGNTMIDTLFRFLPDALALHRTKVHALDHSWYALLTLHRAGNVDDPRVLRRLIQGMAEVGRVLPILFPVHPRTRRRIEEAGIDLAAVPGLAWVSPEGYMEILSLIADAAIVLTDSGGMQQECAALGTPCLVLREVTEHRATVASGACRLVGTDPERILSELVAVLEAPRSDPAPIPGWDGAAGARVADALSRLVHAPSEPPRPRSGAPLRG